MAEKGKFTKKIKVDGKEYTLQKLPVREGLELRKRCRVGSDIDDIAFYSELLEHVVMEPKMDLDDFESIGHLEDLMVEVVDYQYRGK